MKKLGHPSDPRGLIFEAYRMPDLSEKDCRTILLDWALGLDAGIDPQELLPSLHHSYARSNPDHPMTALIEEGMAELLPKARRGRFSKRRK